MCLWFSLTSPASFNGNYSGCCHGAPVILIYDLSHRVGFARVRPGASKKSPKDTH